MAPPAPVSPNLRNRPGRFLVIPEYGRRRGRQFLLRYTSPCSSYDDRVAARSDAWRRLWQAASTSGRRCLGPARSENVGVHAGTTGRRSALWSGTRPPGAFRFPAPGNFQIQRPPPVSRFFVNKDGKEPHVFTNSEHQAQSISAKAPTAPAWLFRVVLPAPPSSSSKSSCEKARPDNPYWPAILTQHRGERRGKAAHARRVAWRAEAQPGTMLSTASMRNEADVALSRLAAHVV